MCSWMIRLRYHGNLWNSIYKKPVQLRHHFTAFNRSKLSWSNYSNSSISREFLISFFFCWVNLHLTIHEYFWCTFLKICEATTSQFTNTKTRRKKTNNLLRYRLVLVSVLYLRFARVVFQFHNVKKPVSPQISILAVQYTACWIMPLIYRLYLYVVN